MKLLHGVLGLLVVSGAVGLVAQEAAPDEGVHTTLHVYADLVQVPTLVLTGNMTALQAQIEEKRFAVSIDSGPWFQVTHARLEGNDPISLSILLDTNSVDFMPGIGDPISALAPSLLSPRDHVSIYAMDCGLTRSLNNVPASSGELKTGVDALVWTTRGLRKDTPCKQKPVHLWDAIGYVASQLTKLPGRRVILVVTDGHDRGSTRRWSEVRFYTQAVGVAVFGVTGMPVVISDSSGIVLRKDRTSLQAICEMSGGMLTMTYPALTGKALQRTIEMLRGRYIVEFPRPSNSTQGEHDMRIRIANGESYFIRPSGISVPIPDTALKSDPSTVQADPSHAPEQGKRRILQNPK
jgi:hypothetical protein